MAFSDTFEKLVDTGLDVFVAREEAKNAEQVAKTQTKTTEANRQAYAPETIRFVTDNQQPIIIGGIVLVAVLLLVRGN